MSDPYDNVHTSEELDAKMAAAFDDKYLADQAALVFDPSDDARDDLSKGIRLGHALARLGAGPVTALSPEGEDGITLYFRGNPDEVVARLTADVSAREAAALAEAREAAEAGADERIDALRAELRGLTTGWREDGSTPPNWIREAGTGGEVSWVDVHMSGHQNPHTPMVVGWKVHVGTRCDSGLVMVSEMSGMNDEMRRDAAIAEAQRLADEALRKIRTGR